MHVTGGVGEAYADAYRLLTQLRSVTRRLTDGLDSTSLADDLLRAVADVAACDRGAVFVRSEGGALTQLGAVGPDGTGTAVRWGVDLAADGTLAEAWRAQLPRVRNAQHEVPGEPPRPGSALAVPLRVGSRTVGVVGLETRRAAAYPPAVVAAVAEVAASAALRLETALLFAELRATATNEERRRLAREIHDGIAQDLASLGYALDGLIADADHGVEGVPDGLREVRRNLGGVLREVRESITALRTSVDEHGGLASAVSDYARVVGRAAPFRVHLCLDETAARLSAETEGELLRIAQEAITNARRHARARNLWVTCLVEPPAALLRVEDDGTGLSGARRHDSHGLTIMHERAEKVGAELSIRGRQPSGTLVEVALRHRSARAGEPGALPDPEQECDAGEDADAHRPR